MLEEIREKVSLDKAEVHPQHKRLKKVWFSEVIYNFGFPSLVLII
jgi:hypothetical protein